MTQIEITGAKRNPSYLEVFSKMRFTLPAVLGTGSNPIQGLDKILSSYGGYYSEIIPVTGTVIAVDKSMSVNTNDTQTTIQTKLQNEYNAIRSWLDNLSLESADLLAGTHWNGSTWSSIANITDTPIVAGTQANLSATATGASGAAVTLTLPAVSGKFHNILHLTVIAYAVAAKTGLAAPIVVTSTNIAGNPAFTFQSAFAIGTTSEKLISPALPIKSAVPNTATTIVCPATTNIIWRITAFYNTSE